jgi:hypothetical protein
VLADSEQFPSLGGAGTSMAGAPPAAEAAHGGRAGMHTMAAVLTKVLKTLACDLGASSRAVPCTAASSHLLLAVVSLTHASAALTLSRPYCLCLPLCST